MIKKSPSFNYHNKDQLALFCKDSNNEVNNQKVALKGVFDGGDHGDGGCDGGGGGGVSDYLESIAKGYNAPVPGEPLVELVPEINLLKGVDTAMPYCGKGYTMKGECENGHRVAKVIYCGREYCRVCGEKWSISHQRRYYRWLPELNTMKSVGHLVLTFPEETWDLFDQSKLREIRRYVIRFLKRKGYDRGFARYHLCGEDGKTWKPHLHILIQAGWIDKKELEQWRELFTAKVETMFDIHCKSGIVHKYKYSENDKRHRFWLRYQTRATWRVFDRDIARMVFRFNLGVKWGEFNKRKGEQNDVALLEKNQCPVCYGTIKWLGVSQLDTPEDWKQIEGGYYLWKYRLRDKVKIKLE